MPAASVDTVSSSVLARIGSDAVTFADVRTRIGDNLAQLDGQYRRARDKMVGAALDSIIAERLLTNEVKKGGKSADQLIAAEMATRAEPTEAEIAAWHSANPEQVRGRSLDQLRPDIANLLRSDRRRLAYNKLLARLKDENGVRVEFEPWKPQFANQGAPAMGKENAPVTLVEFSDFQCPYCRAAAPTLKQVNQKFGDRVRIVYRQYPIPSLHPFALKAAEASLCANDQRKFWELHDAMFENQNRLTVTDLKQTARRLGMDGRTFDECLDSGRYAGQVLNDMREGARVGVTGTPTMYVNGMQFEGVVPFATLDSVISRELAKHGGGR
jgi:predicted DsbA family dithiol-disulfide isomerase